MNWRFVRMVRAGDRLPESADPTGRPLTGRADRLRAGRSLRGLLVACVLVATVATVLILWLMVPADAQLERAQAALEAQDFSTALRHARSALAQDPELTEAHWLAGRAAAGMGRVPAALEHFAKVPDDGSVFAIDARTTAGALLLLQQRQLTLAEQQFRRALEQDPDSLTALDSMAFILGVSGRNWELIPYRLKLIAQNRIEPLHLYLLSLGESALENDHLVSEYHQSNPEDPAPKLALARLAYEEHNYDEARGWLRDVLQARPEMAEAHAKLGRVILQDGDAAEFLAWYERLPQAAFEHPGVWALCGAWAARNEQTEVAIRCYWEALRRNANHEEANYQLGQKLAAAGRDAEAELFLQRAGELQRYMNAVKVAVEGAEAAGARQAAAEGEQLGLLWEAYAWLQKARELDRDRATADRSKAVALRERAAGNTQTRNVADANPALQVDLSSYPLPNWRGGVVGDVAHAARQRQPERDVQSLSFEDRAAAAGIDFRYYNAGDPVQAGIEHMYEFTGGGLAVLDLDLNGWPDLYATQGSEWPPRAGQRKHLDRLFLNLGNGQFRDVTQSADLQASGFGQGVAAGDYDNDGFPDLYVANIGGNLLLRNNGDGTFQDVTDEAQVASDRWTSSCLIADLNGDSLPDLYDVNYLTGNDVFTRVCGEAGGRGVCMPQFFPAQQDQVYINQGDGSFVDVTESSGIVRPDGKGLGVVAADFDGGGQLSLFIANDAVPNFFFVNQAQRGGSLEYDEQALLRGLAINADGKAEACMGVAVDDVDGDQLLDLYVTNFYQESNTLYVQQPLDAQLGSRFEDGTQRAGLRDSSIYQLGFGTQFLDADLDSRPDLFAVNGHIADFRSQGQPYQMPPLLYANGGEGRFAQVPAEAAGPYFSKLALGRPVVRLDWNRDGREDLAVTHLDAPLALLTNTTAAHGRYLAVHLRGVQGSRDALGATVQVTTDKGTSTRQLVGGDGYHASNERRLVFGLGDGTEIRSMTVRWPGGQTQSFTDLSLDSEIMLVEGQTRFWPVLHQTQDAVK